MDISKLTHGAKLVLGGTIVFLIVTFFKWQEVEYAGFSSGVSMWHGVGFIAGLLAIALLVWEGLRLVNIEVALPVGPAMTSAFLAILLVFFTIIKFLVDGEFRTFWAWLGLALAIAIAVGAVMNMQAAGHSFSDVKDTLASGAAAASSAAKSASSSEGSAAPPASTPAPPTAPPSSGGVGESASEAASTAEDAAREATDRPDPPAA
jgi:hypothetical protein